VSNVLGCICEDGVGTITDVEGNINSAKCIDILDNNLLVNLGMNGVLFQLLSYFN
jgi:hypothetical protein